MRERDMISMLDSTLARAHKHTPTHCTKGPTLAQTGITSEMETPTRAPTHAIAPAHAPLYAHPIPVSSCRQPGLEPGGPPRRVRTGPPSHGRRLVPVGPDLAVPARDRPDIRTWTVGLQPGGLYMTEI